MRTYEKKFEKEIQATRPPRLALKKEEEGGEVGIMPNVLMRGDTRRRRILTSSSFEKNSPHCTIPPPRVQGRHNDTPTRLFIGGRQQIRAKLPG